MARSTPGAADRVCEFLLRQEDLPANRTQVLELLSMLPGRIHLDQATVRALTRAVLRHRIARDLQPDAEHPLGLLLYGADAYTALVTEEMTSYIETLLASQDAADRAEALRIVLEIPDVSIAPEIDGRPPVTVPMPAEFRKTFRDWTENKLSVTAPRLTPAQQVQGPHLNGESPAGWRGRVWAAQEVCRPA